MLKNDNANEESYPFQNKLAINKSPGFCCDFWYEFTGSWVCGALKPQKFNGKFQKKISQPLEIFMNSSKFVGNKFP